MFLLSALLFTIAGLSGLGNFITGLLNAFASTLFAISTIGLVNEYFLSDRYQRHFILLGDQSKTGLQRVLTSDETREYIRELMPKASCIESFSIAFRWLLERKEERNRLRTKIESGCKITLLFPDPTQEEIKLRIERDEAELPRFSLEQLKLNLRKLDQLLEKLNYPKNIRVRLYKNYPTVSLIIFDDHIFLSTYVVGALGTDTLTFYFRGSNKCLQPYLEHISFIFESDGYSRPLSEYIEEERMEGRA
jgi:hypothetical protein